MLMCVSRATASVAHTHQPELGNQAQPPTSVGAREDDEGLGGPLRSPAGRGVAMFPQDGKQGPGPDDP